jgi:hypothetical protein
VGGGVQLPPLGTAATNRPIVPVLDDYDNGEIGGMIGMGSRSTRRKPAPVPLCPPQTPHAARTRTRAASVGSQRPLSILLCVCVCRGGGKGNLVSECALKSPPVQGQ